MADTLTITDNRTGKQYQIPIKEGAIKAIDLRQIKTGEDDSGLMTYDPAFMNTAACRSAITYIDGDKGILEYRGYPIEQLAERSTYLETAYLVIFGELPSESQLKAWTREITLHTMLHENIKKLMEGFQYRRASNGRVPEHRRCVLHLLSGRKEHLRREVAEEADPPAHCQGPDDCRLRLPPQHRPSLHLSRQRTELRRQLPEHAVPDDRAEIPGEPHPRARARSAVHPARGPRAELQHDGDARHRQLPCRPVLRNGGRRGSALRSAARRGQRSGAAHAPGDRQCRQGPRVHQAGQGGRGAADGLRPPGLQVCTIPGPR